MRPGRWARAALGAACGALAWLAPGTLTGGVAWCAAVGIAALGYGVIVERAARQRVAPVLTVVAGLAALLATSTLAAHAGLLARHTIAGAVALGVLASTLPRLPAPAREPAPGARAMGVLTACALAVALVAVALVRGAPLLADRVDHAFAIAHLWDLGQLPALHHQAGLALVGEAYLALASGAQAAGVFDAACAALLIALLAGELAARREPGADLMLLVASLAIALRVVPPGAWPATLLHVALLLALGAAPREGRVAWHAIVLAVALALVRSELAFLAAPYAVAAIVLAPHGRRFARVAIASWLVAAVPLQFALGGHGLPLAAVIALALLAALPLGRFLARVVATAELATPVGAACAAIACATLAVGLGAVPRAAHDESATFAIWFGFALAILAWADDGATEAPRDPVRPGAAVVALAFVAASTLVPLVHVIPALHVEEPYATAVIALRDRLSARDERADQDAVRALQDRTPRGARVAFWGTNAGELDFTRNPIRDLTFAGGEPLALVPPAALGGAAYVIVDGDASPRSPDPWLPPHEHAHVSPLWRARDRVTLLATAGRARLYAVSPAPPPARRD